MVAVAADQPPVVEYRGCCAGLLASALFLCGGVVTGHVAVMLAVGVGIAAVLVYAGVTS